MTSDYSSTRSSGRSRYIAVAAILALAGAIPLWPTTSRRVERQITALSELLSCSGRPLGTDRIQALRDAIRANFSATTAMTIQSDINDSFSQERLVQAIVEACTSLTQLQIHLNQVAVDIGRDQLSAQARADVSIEYESRGRSDREHRRANFSLRKEGQSYRITAVEVSADIVNQPEPRP
jgi:hypothetical protein